MVPHKFAASAPKNTLHYISVVLKYKNHNPRLAFSLLRSAYNHLWYVCPQTVVLALCDERLADEEREDLAKALHKQQRVPLESGKPEFPFIDLSGDSSDCVKLSSLVNSSSWLIWDMLLLLGSQDWLLIPVSMWDHFSGYQTFKKFATNLTVTNDIAERGIALVTEFLNKHESEEQRQALLQVVEWHRGQVKVVDKASLSLC